MSIPVIELDQADSSKRGQAYGEAAGSAIRSLLELYKELFRKTTERSWSNIVSMLDSYISKTIAFAPDLVDEIHGIATGANLSFSDIFAINARSEILFDLQGSTQECSSLAVLPGATRNQSTLLGQNWDWNKDTESCQVILKIGRRENLPSLVTFTEAGQLSKIGMNSAGIGLVVNTLSADRSCAGIPWIFLSRRILESGRMAQAKAYLLGCSTGHSMNYLIAHEDGEAVDIETSCVENHIIAPTEPFMAHTNHYLRPCSGFTDNRVLLDNPSTHIRLHRMLKLLGQMSGRLDVAAVQDIFKDHENYPFSVCIHESDQLAPGQQAIKTCLSVVMDLSGKSIFYTRGNPCRNPVERLDLAGYFN